MYLITIKILATKMTMLFIRSIAMTAIHPRKRCCYISDLYIFTSWTLYNCDRMFLTHFSTMRCLLIMCTVIFMKFVGFVKMYQHQEKFNDMLMLVLVWWRSFNMGPIMFIFVCSCSMVLSHIWLIQCCVFHPRTHIMTTRRRGIHAVLLSHGVN